MKLSPREMVIWLRGEWRAWKHGPLPTNLSLSRVTDDLADFVEQNRWRKLSEEKPSEEGYYELGVWSGLTRRWYSTQGKFSGGRFAEGFTHWRPIVSPEEES